MPHPGFISSIGGEVLALEGRPGSTASERMDSVLRRRFMLLGPGLDFSLRTAASSINHHFSFGFVLSSRSMHAFDRSL